MPSTLTYPLTVTPTGQLATTTQGSVQDVASCVGAILRTPPGWRLDDPEFGRPAHLVFRQGGVVPQEIADAILAHEPRATGEIVAGAIADGRQDVRVDATGSTR